MPEMFRSTKLERYVKQLEVRSDVHKNSPVGSQAYGKCEALKEVVAELKHEFNIGGAALNNKEKIIAALENAVLCDDCLSEKSGVSPRNAVNQYCNKMDEIERHKRKPCDSCKNMYRLDKYVNELMKEERK